MHNIEFYDDLL